MRTTEYTVDQMRSLLQNMSGMYDLARVVDPIECRILEFQSDGAITMNQRCYGIWNAEQRCVNCSSAVACKTGCHQEKAEYFEDSVYHIQSNPVKLKLPGGDNYDAVVELVSIERDKRPDGHVNDRAAENVGHRAAQYQAIHDSLTKVLNAGAFYELSREMILRQPGKSWVMVTGNIMHFRLVNALFGVVKGNEVLSKTADMLEKYAHQSEGMCGRLGGDQFALMIPRAACREEMLLNIAQLLSNTFSSGIFTFCIHFGVYAIEDASLPVSVMCGRANSALYTIRESLTETVAWFDDAILQRSLFEQQVISGFEDALRNGEFQMYLQPLAGERHEIFGAEALVRWHRSDGTVLMPGAFIETLEQAGLIHQLDMYLWECAVRQLSLWDSGERARMTISVNMSAKDFYSIDLCDVLSKLIEKYHVDSRRLRLEITETALLEEPNKSNSVVSQLRKMGFLVEIDDFGKGYSSLSMLKDIQADVLKIDMSLLREIESKRRSRIILASVIDMAGELGMDVITEGVETEAQLRTLSDMGCHRFQGYLFSRPIPVGQFEKLVFG